MTSEKLLYKLEAFDPELYDLLSYDLSRQRTTLSLIPTTNAASPFAAFLKGSSLGDDVIDHHAMEHCSRLEWMAARRACELYGAEEAIVRNDSLAAASRVVLLTLIAPGDTVLSFNLRKKEYCTGDLMRYNFVKFGVEPESFRLDFAKIRELALKHRPRLIIYSPVNYPRNIDPRELKKIADEVGAYLWVDLGQNSGLAAAGLIPSPVHQADVVTFAASDALHGPQSGIILCKSAVAARLRKTMQDTGLSSLKKNILASLVITFREAACEEYRDYCLRVIANAKALEKGLTRSGARVLGGPTENHLVLLRLPSGLTTDEVAERLDQAGLLVKAENLMTADDAVCYPILRLSSLDAATRSLGVAEMEELGTLLAGFIETDCSGKAFGRLAGYIEELVESLPLIAADWLPEIEAVE